MSKVRRKTANITPSPKAQRLLRSAAARAANRGISKTFLRKHAAAIDFILECEDYAYESIGREIERLKSGFYNQ